MATAFVLSGGGSLGAVQVGMLQALAARGVRPDLLVGTSAVAVNAAFVAGRGVDDRALRELETGPRHRRRGGGAPSPCSPAGLRTCRTAPPA